jgi:hypothetical protein
LIQRLLMLMLWMCCLSFAQEEKNELGLLGAEFIPRTATTSNQKLSFGRSVAYSVDYARRLSSGSAALLLDFRFAAGPSHKVESAQLNAITSLATLFVTPSLRAQFVSPLLHRHDYPWASDRDSTREVAYFKTELLTRRFTGTWRQRYSGGIDVRTRLKLLFPIGFRGEFRDFYTLGSPCFCSALRTA